MGAELPSRRELSLRHSLSVAGATAQKPDPPRLNLLGGFELQATSQPVRVPQHVQRLLAFLALQGRPLHRAYIAGRLWIDHSQVHAHGCLRTTLWRMGQLPCPVVDVTSRHLALAADVVVDARELEACIERVLHNGAAPLSGDIDLLIQAAELLPDWYDDWVFHERERLRQLRLVALEAAGEGLIGEGRYSDAAVAALAATASDPFRESSYRLLVRSCIEAGNVAEALRQFTLFRARLGQVGLEPSPQMRDLLSGDGLRWLVDQAPWMDGADRLPRGP